VADYDLTSWQFSKRGSVLVAIQRAQQIVDGLAQVRSQSDFAETRAAIREYASSTLRLPVKDTD
jgi:DNA-directed RNA polymerase subunit K/omega